MTVQDLEQSVLAAVNADEAWQTVVDLSDTVRLSGNDDEAKAIKYLTSKLDSYGVDYTLHTPELFVSWPMGSTLRVLGENGYSIQAKSPAMSISTNGEEVEGELLYVESTYAGAAISLFQAFDFGDADFTGKVVMTEGMPMPGKVNAIMARGAAAAIFIGPGTRIHEGVCTSIWGSPDFDSMHRQPAIPILALNNPEGKQLAELAKKETVRVAFSTKLDTQWRKIPVLVAEIKGTAAPDEWLLLHGHLDGWHIGVGDNLTGDATILEVARVLKQHEGDLKRSIRFAWWSGHSHGRYAGSTWFADEFAIDIAENCIAQVDCDSPGCRWTSVFTDVMFTEEAGGLVAGAIEDVTGEPTSWARPLRAGDYSFNNLGVTGYLMLSSTMPEELRKEKNYYAVGGCGGNIAWHTEDDILEIGDKDNLHRDVKIYAAAVLRALNATVPPFDFRLTLDSFEKTLADYQASAGDAFDLSPALTDIAALRSELDGFYASVEALGDVDPGSAEAMRASTIQRQLARLLVSVNYSRQGR
ncbi:MAG: M28 family peptidase, partial [Thermomicrobiales bacterium]|nr:M28 family peptidase [Thermomicrobiales bacterium]